MQVKNEYVKIKSGKKEYTLKNWIYDSYLKLFSDYQKQTYQMYGITETMDTELKICCIKVDTPLDDYKNASTYDFDIFIPCKNINFSGNENGTNVVYEYSSLTTNYTNKIDLTAYDGKKITAIGFCGITEWRDVTPVYELFACLDTNFYSIYINKFEEINVSRKDIIMSNAVCDGIDYPLHLSPISTRINEDEIAIIRAILYSVGFGRSRGKMQQEFIIGKDAKIETINDTKYGIAMKNPIQTPKYPQFNNFPSSSKYPISPKYLISVYPKEKMLYPNKKKYPMKAGYNYIIFKYRLYYNVLNTIKYLDEYYTMSYICNPKGVFTITNTIERG